MNIMKRTFVGGATALMLVACAGNQQGSAVNPCGGDPCSGNPCGAAPESQGVGPLKVGAGYESWTKLNTKPWKSKTHGNRMVEIYVNEVGLEAYKSDEADLPVGSVVVKTSFEDDGAEGPVFVMEKRAAGFSPDHSDWYYALYWPKVSAKWQSKVGTSAYWESPSDKVGYCWKCHDKYDRELGGVPDEVATWKQ